MGIPVAGRTVMALAWTTDTTTDGDTRGENPGLGQKEAMRGGIAGRSQEPSGVSLQARGLTPRLLIFRSNWGNQGGQGNT
jgi:hypothetical protein